MIEYILAYYVSGGSIMKKITFLTMGVFMALVVLSGCANKTPSVAAATRNITGELTYLSVPLEGGPAYLTVNTTQGVQTIPLTDNTTYKLDGKACSLDDIGKALANGDTTYECMAVASCEADGWVGQYVAVSRIIK